MAQLIVNEGVLTNDFGWLKSHWGLDIARIFYIYDVPQNVARGHHRLLRCQMGLVCIAGTVDIYIQTPDNDEHYRLDSPYNILLVEPTDWRVMHNFSADAILLVLADHSYYETTYIDTPYRPIGAEYQSR